MLWSLACLLLPLAAANATAFCGTATAPVSVADFVLSEVIEPVKGVADGSAYGVAIELTDDDDSSADDGFNIPATASSSVPSIEQVSHRGWSPREAQLAHPLSGSKPPLRPPMA